MTSIGQILADARRKRKMTIKDVEKAIKIRAKYISALEQDAFNQIAGEAYVIGFIKTYAQWLEIDGNALIDRYKEQTEPIKQSVAVGQELSDDVHAWYKSKLVYFGGIAVFIVLAVWIIMMVLPGS